MRWPRDSAEEGRCRAALVARIGGDDRFAPASIAERFWEIAESRFDVELRFE